MTEAQAFYEHLSDKFCKKDGVAVGKMMSSPAIQCKGKVFAFFHNEKMTFKLGKDFDPDSYGLMDWGYLSPFKNKPPMTAWVIVPFEEKEKWEALTEMAWVKMQT